MRITYELFDVHDDADEGDLLFFDALGDQIVLEEMGVVDVGADVARIGLLPPQSLLGNARRSGQQVVRDFPREQLLEGPAAGCLVMPAPLVQCLQRVRHDLLCRAEELRLACFSLHDDVRLDGAH